MDIEARACGERRARAARPRRCSRALQGTQGGWGAGAWPSMPGAAVQGGWEGKGGRVGGWDPPRAARLVPSCSWGASAGLQQGAKLPETEAACPPAAWASTPHDRTSP